WTKTVLRLHDKEGSPPWWAPFNEVICCRGRSAGQIRQTVAGTPWKKARSPTEFDVNLTRSARFSLTHELCHARSGGGLHCVRCLLAPARRNVAPVKSGMFSRLPGSIRSGTRDC